MTNPMQTVSARAVLTFGDAHGRVSSFSVPRARTDKTPAEALAAMQAIIATGALELRCLDGPATLAKKAAIVKTVRNRLI